MYAEDLTPFFDTEDGFATLATGATLRSGVAVHFDAAYTPVVSGLTIESTLPAITGPAASLAAAVPGSAVSVNGADYLVRSQQPDGTGIMTLLLELAS